MTRLRRLIAWIARPSAHETWMEATYADLMRQLHALSNEPVPEPDPATVARLDQHLADCRARLQTIRGDLDQLREGAR